MTRFLLVVALVLAGCTTTSTSSDGSSPAGGGSITVYAAASLSDVFEALTAAYTDATGVDVVLSFDASSALRAQIEEGAPADVFASADLANAEALVDAGRTNGASRTFAGNALAIVTPTDNPAGIDTWGALAQPGARIIAAGEDVPITRYATELVDNLAGLPDAPDGFADGYAANVVSREDNVRSVLAKIEIGEGDAAIVYETDAQSGDVATVIIPDGANVVAEYAVVAIAGAGFEATGFVVWLLDDDAHATLADYGFRPAP